MLITTVSLFAGGASQGSEKVDGNTIYLAIQAPFTGDNAQYGESIKNAVTLKVNEVNAKGGINGKKIVVDLYDDKNDSNEAATLAQKICDQKKYTAVFGGFASGATLACAPVYRKNGMFHIAPTAGHPDISIKGGTTWAMGMEAILEWTAGGIEAVEDVGHGPGTKVALIHLYGDNGLIVREGASKGVQQAGGKMVAIESFINGQVRDFTPILNKIKAANPDVLYIGCQYADAAAMLIQARQIGFNPNMKFLLSNDCFVPAIKEAAGDALEDKYLTSPWSPLKQTPGVQKFVQEYNKAFNIGDPSSYAAVPYEGICILMSALEAGCTTTAELQNYFNSLGQWGGATFAGYFDEKQRFVRTDKMVLVTVKNGDWVVIPTK